MYKRQVDPYANAHEVEEEYNIKLVSEPSGQYVATIVAVAHQNYLEQSPADLCSHVTLGGIFMDVKGLFDAAPDGYTYWRM